MNFYITSGTHDFMQKLQMKNESEILIFQNSEESILIHETTGKSVFAAPRKYDVIYSNGEICVDNTLTLESFYVDKVTRPIFIERFLRNADEIFSPSSMIGMRALQPINTDLFCLVISWHDQIDLDSINRYDISTLVGKNKTNIFVPKKITKKYFPVSDD